MRIQKESFKHEAFSYSPSSLWGTVIFRLLIVVLVIYVCSAQVHADEIREPGVYIVQNVFTPDGRPCIANEVTKDVYIFSSSCGEQIIKASSMVVNLVGIDGTLHEAGARTSLVDAGVFYVFDTRAKKSRPDIEGLLRPARNTTAIWYPDFSRGEVVSSDIELESKGSGKLKFTQPVAFNASGVVAYKGNIPFCMVDGSKGECLVLKDIFLGWGKRFSCGSNSRVSANLSFYCNPESYYCRHHCEDKQECQLSYGSYSQPDSIECKSGAYCHFYHDPAHIKGHCSAGGCAYQEALVQEECEYGCSYDTHTLKKFDGLYTDQKIFTCDQPKSSDTSLKIIVKVGIGITFGIFVFSATAIARYYKKQRESEIFHNKYSNY